MNETPFTQQDINDLTQEIEQSESKLSPEMKQYLHEGMKKLIEKSNNSSVSENDMKFIKNVREWLALPDHIREMFPDYKGLEEAKITSDLERMGISQEQWLNLLHMADAIGKDKKWIKDNCEFEEGIIELKASKSELELFKNNPKLKRLPLNLSVSRFNLSGCVNLVEIPEGVSTDDLNVEGCTSLVSIKSKLHLSFDLNCKGCVNLVSINPWIVVEGDAYFNGCKKFKGFQPNDSFYACGVLDFTDCESLLGIPNETTTTDSLILKNCVNLTSLPGGMEIGRDCECEGCINLVHIEAGTKITNEFNLKGCTKITYIPDMVAQFISLPGDVPEDVYKKLESDCEKLIKAGQLDFFI